MRAMGRKLTWLVIASFVCVFSTAHSQAPLSIAEFEVVRCNSTTELAICDEFDRSFRMTIRQTSDSIEIVDASFLSESLAFFTLQAVSDTNEQSGSTAFYGIEHFLDMETSVSGHTEFFLSSDFSSGAIVKTWEPESPVRSVLSLQLVQVR